MHLAIESMATVELTAVGPAVQGPPGAATGGVLRCEVFVDVATLVDIGAEIGRIAKENEKTASFIAAKQAKLVEEAFLARAPEAVVRKEREQLDQLQAKLAKGVATLAELEARR